MRPGPCHRLPPSLLGAVLLACGLALGCARHAGPPDVVLIVLDTARADHLSLYGYPRNTSPHLVDFARGAIRFDHAYSTSCWTLAAHASLFTGLLPATHGATQENLHLDDELDTLAELLGAAGYDTAAFSNNSWVSKATNLTQGFDEVQAMWRKPPPTRGDGLPHPTNQSILEWLAKRNSARPFFLFVNYIEPHWPYRPPQAYRHRFLGPRTPAHLERRANFPAITWYARGLHPPAAVLRVRTALYDGELAYLDAVVADLFAGLRARGLLDDALVIVTADHGENLGDKGHQGHSFTLYEPTSRVPLVVRRPGGRDGGSVRSDPVALPDVFATIAAAAGVAVSDPRVVGVDLLRGPLPEERPLVAEYYRPDMFLSRFAKDADVQARIAPYRRRIRSIRVGPDKLIWGSDGQRELYDTARDPGERNDLMTRDPERAQQLESQLDAIVAARTRPVREPHPVGSALDEDTKAHLRKLGYLP